MQEDSLEFGYTSDGKPVDYTDKEKKIRWIYQGKGENGCDEWYGIPLED